MKSYGEQVTNEMEACGHHSLGSGATRVEVDASKPQLLRFPASNQILTGIVRLVTF